MKINWNCYVISNLNIFLKKINIGLKMPKFKLILANVKMRFELEDDWFEYYNNGKYS